MKKTHLKIGVLLLGFTAAAFIAYSFSPSFFGKKTKQLQANKGFLEIPVADINNGEAHYFKAKADNGIIVTFFTLKSRDGVIRAAIDACDVCFQAGKGYTQEGEFMVCENCGQRFASNMINVIKGGCNPAPLNRRIMNDHLLISMRDINVNSWYCKYKDQNRTT